MYLQALGVAAENASVIEDTVIVLQVAANSFLQGFVHSTSYLQYHGPQSVFSPSGCSGRWNGLRCFLHLVYEVSKLLPSISVAIDSFLESK